MLCVYVSDYYKYQGSDMAHLVEHQASNRKVAKLGSTSDAVPHRCVLRKDHVGAKQSTWMVWVVLEWWMQYECKNKQIKECKTKCKQKSSYVSVVWQTQSVQYLVQTKKKKMVDWLRLDYIKYTLPTVQCLPGSNSF